MISVHEQRTENGNYIGWLTLNLPQTLNALTLNMVCAARLQLEQWATRPNIACVVLQGEGRGFCAGGDVRRMRTGILDNDTYCEQFFEQEYRLDYAIHRYPKPVLVWGHGVVMGGGLGLLVGASHRVVTASSRLAMPEINIGLYPDVGGSYFLNRLPPGLGLFLGITGCEWNGADAVALQMADILLADHSKTDLPDVLAHTPWNADPASNRDALTQALSQLAPAEQSVRLFPHSAELATACQGSLAQAVEQLLALPLQEDWFQHARDNLRRGCPVTAHIVAEQLRRGSTLSLPDVFRMEWNISLQCCRRPDFPEGVRAQLVDKDKQPRWSHTDIRNVSAEYVASHFTAARTSNPLADLA